MILSFDYIIPRAQNFHCKKKFQNVIVRIIHFFDGRASSSKKELGEEISSDIELNYRGVFIERHKEEGKGERYILQR